MNPGFASQNKRMHGVLTISQVPAASYLAIRREGCLCGIFLIAYYWNYPLTFAILPKWSLGLFVNNFVSPYIVAGEFCWRLQICYFPSRSSNLYPKFPNSIPAGTAGIVLNIRSEFLKLKMEIILYKQTLYFFIIYYYRKSYARLFLGSAS